MKYVHIVLLFCFQLPLPNINVSHTNSYKWTPLASEGEGWWQDIDSSARQSEPEDSLEAGSRGLQDE